MRNAFVVTSIVALLGVALLGLWWAPLWLLGLMVGPLVALGAIDMTQAEHSLRRNFPLVGRGRWLMEVIRPFVRQYFIESETDGAPVARMFRSVVYQRAKGASDTVPFGTKVDTYRDGYEWIGHSIAALESHGDDAVSSDASGRTAPQPAASSNRLGGPRVLIGGEACTQPYSASLLNISAMSFGSLSPRAILALNGGAHDGGFAHNTGEGGLSRFHLEHGGDLIWQIGTGYFGCRDERGGFAPERFALTAAHEAVRMIEIKISQGAKPGHGGILPAVKNTRMIAEARGVEPGTLIASPPAHSAFGTPLELLAFVARLRELSGGKPVGFKLCVGRESEFAGICKAMVQSGIRPDFITVDGGEGGTGAAPLEFSNSVGMPLREGLAFVCDCLSGFELKGDIRVIAVGKVFTAFHMVRNLALGADLCYSARGFMMSLGCVQSLLCNTNHCPTGVATQDEGLQAGLVVGDKRTRVARFHHETLQTLAEIVAAAGLRSARELNRTHVYRRVSQQSIKRYDELFPYADIGSLRSEPWPRRFQQQMVESSADSFVPDSPIAQYRAGIHELDTPASA